jgi:cation diffusion facilitator family transporter
VTDGSRKAIFAAFFANLGIAIAKFVGFALTQSASLLAEGVHSLADTGNQALLFLGARRAQHEETPMHPFGYGRERYFWAFAVALVLFSMGGMFALYEGIDKLRHPHEVENLAVAISILVFALALEAYSLHTAVKESRRVKGSTTSWWTFLRTTKQPELPVVLLEDIGAGVGLVLALVGVITAQVTDEPRWDAVGSIAIGVLLVTIAVFLAIEMKSLLIGEAADRHVRASIVEAIERGPEVDQLIHMRTQHIGPDEILVTAKIEYSSSMDVDELVAAINATEGRIRAVVPTATIIYLEPDIMRADHPDGPPRS